VFVAGRQITGHRQLRHLACMHSCLLYSTQSMQYAPGTLMTRGGARSNSSSSVTCASSVSSLVQSLTQLSAVAQLVPRSLAQPPLPAAALHAADIVLFGSAPESRLQQLARSVAAAAPASLQVCRRLLTSHPAVCSCSVGTLPFPVQPPLPAAALSAATWFRAVQPPSRLQQTEGRR
jgi:hypothetical protein